MKSEPDVYSWDDLEKEGQAEWDGVRNVFSPHSRWLCLLTPKQGVTGLYIWSQTIFPSGSIRVKIFLDIFTEPNSTYFLFEKNQRNYQARNMMRDEMKMNDLVLFYHSNTKPHPHIAGIAKVLGRNDFYVEKSPWTSRLEGIKLKL